MPRQNRVDPWGEIVASPERGMFTGNRGSLHQDGYLMKKWARKAWVTCLLEFEGRHRQIMSPGCTDKLTRNLGLALPGWGR